MRIGKKLSKAAAKGFRHVAKGLRRVAGPSAPAGKSAERQVAGTLGRDVFMASGATKAGRRASKVAESKALDVALGKFDLNYDGATRQWLSANRGKNLLDALKGFQLERDGFLKLARSVGGQPVEVSRVRAIGDFVRARPWMNPDLVTVEGFRRWVPEGRRPLQEELNSVVRFVDHRFNRTYRIGTDWADDLHAWEPLGTNAQHGDEGISYWVRNRAGEIFMAKVPSEPRRGVNERVGYGIHRALGVPTNEVRYGQRDWQPLVTLHKRIEGDPVGLDRVAQEIGIDKADFRLGSWPYPPQNIGTGPSTWGRKGARKYQTKIATGLEDPAIFDKLHFIGRIDDDPDLKPGNMLATVARVNADGTKVYRIHRIDFGIMHDGWALRNLRDDVQAFGRYLRSLVDPENSTHLANILGTMKQFASMSDDNLTRDLLGNIWRNADGTAAAHMPPTYQLQMARRFLEKRDLVRAWLEEHRALTARLMAT